MNISTVSRRLDKLEQGLDARLFDRTPQGTLPTADAIRLAPFAEAMEQAAQDFGRGLEGFEVEPAGVVRLAAMPGLIDHFLASALPDLVARYPELRIELSSSTGYADLARREADLALRARRPTAGDLVARLLLTTGWVLMASPAYVESLGRLRRADAARWVTWGQDLVHLPDARWVAEHAPAENVVPRSNGMTGLIEAVRAGLGVMLLPRPYEVLSGLVEVPCAPAPRRELSSLPEMQLWLAGHRAHRSVPRIAAVWDWLVARFEAGPPQRR